MSIFWLDSLDSCTTPDERVCEMKRYKIGILVVVDSAAVEQILVGILDSDRILADWIPDSAHIPVGYCFQLLDHSFRDSDHILAVDFLQTIDCFRRNLAD
ncbi:hypothetical protein GCK72_014005 [Caenorhabditis remanei]|uniref:Uncharacterized protein n=1 Tax=Caenorhabditis remanei TaxID=31234 RepID=A0A6A5GSU4_CAERE|nr:hypothetical protein GCK72_014005 [Caenorhabditis remanei]KAF1757549.1 hypothetical protein GCK72_014005 [Caenorhabditis remanei]